MMRRLGMNQGHSAHDSPARDRTPGVTGRSGKQHFGLRSIRHKLTLGVLLTTVTALLISGSIIIVYDLGDFRERTQQDLRTLADLMGQASVAALQFDDPGVAGQQLALLHLRPQILAAAIYRSDGALFTHYAAADIEPAVLPERPGTADFRSVEGQLGLFQPIQFENEVLGSVYLLADFPYNERLLRDIGIVLGVALLALAISMLVSLWIQTRITRPVLRVSELARKVVEQRDYSLRAEGTTDDEIGYLVEAFNDLLSEIGRRTKALESSNRRLAEEIGERIEASDEVRRLNAELEQRVLERTAELENANKELEAFSYAVSHDLRAPLRSIDGFSQALLEDYQASLDVTGQDYLSRVRLAAQRMGVLIDDLLNLSRVSRTQLDREVLDLSGMAEEIVAQLRESDPQREVEVQIAAGMSGYGDARLIRVALVNLLNNAWKYTGKRSQPRIEFGLRDAAGRPSYFIEDNGAGFDMTYAGRLFGAFQRLHDARDYPGTGVGLATVQRIIRRHGGQIWAEAEVDRGAVFYFTLPQPPETITGDG
ncbi:sensor histidine kinase [Sedimenticola hydrogenitrophicus]|uniref:sensor histidine kinase n=1 Tax=Sedimenticola hydrogenitrophicus TaxID=2967975 RepID=UPI0023B02651|nr:ATP-binding protein [Sedimenticola hydrogenitrophicus]